MTCEQLQPEYDAFALGIAEEPARAEIARHLARQCPHCVPGVTTSLATVTALAGAVKPAEPPRTLRLRVLRLVETKPKRSLIAIYLPWAITALLSLVLIAIGISGQRQSGNTAKLQRALAILNDPFTRDVSFGGTAGGTGARGRFFVSTGKGVVFIGANLPELESGKTFQLWVVPVDGKPVGAGTFEAQPDRTAVYLRPGLVENAAAVAVSVEPENGSEQPTTALFIVSKLGS